MNIVKGNIVEARVDVIVNAANPSLLGGGGVEGAIHRAAGPQLVAECRKIKAVNGVRCPFGEARLTGAGQLPCRYVIHTAGPIYRSESDPAAVLASCYRNSLKLALQQGCKSIVFPAISCGIYGYPADEAAEIAIAVCNEPQYSGLDISFYLFDDAMLQTWLRARDRLMAE